MDSTAPDWNCFARTNAAQRWRKQSAAMGRHMTEAIVDEAKVEPGMDVLDIACGTGEPAISIASFLNGRGSVVGVDISPEPIKLAEERARQRNLTNITFQRADAHQLPFPDHSFDRISSRLGVMFFSDLPKALGEMRRVLRPGGRVALLVWGPIEQPYFATTVLTILKLLPQSKIPPEAGAMFQFGKPGVLGSQLKHASFRDAEDHLRKVEWSWPGPPEDVWEYFQQLTVPFRNLLQSIPENKREVTNGAVLNEIARYYDGEKVNFTATACIATGVA